MHILILCSSYICRSRQQLEAVTKITHDALIDTQNSPEEIKERALQVLREQAQYDEVFTSNEHFATWCGYERNFHGAAATGSIFTSNTFVGGGAGTLVGGLIGKIVPAVGIASGIFIGFY